MTTAEYIQSINQRYVLGNATEHTFRGDLQMLLESLVPTIRATNEPKRQLCGAPDYIITNGEIEIGYIEAKDIGDDDLLGVKKNKEQFHRYKEALPNLIFTDYLTFHIFRDTHLVASITIAEVVKGKIKPLTDQFATFENLIKDFCTYIGQTITNSKKLAKMMAGKARLLSDVIEKSLLSDENTQEDSTLKEQMAGFKDVLMHNITEKEFADVYAQTIAYGMFTARLHDPTLPTFSRQEAAELIPKSNPFLRKLFGYIAGPDIDDRIKWIVDSLVEIFLASNVELLLKDYGKSKKMEDPIIHFYEDFLSEYDPKLRKARGVWYTPQPVVNFIVRAVDDILKTEFGIAQGLADNSKIKKVIKQQGKEIEAEFHKVQILDPATGTGTFLAETIKHIYKRYEKQQGIWSSYVENHLIPRLNGFEILMASYAMAHLKLDLLLNETGFKPTKQQRFKVYLTNSLEESDVDTGTIFANWLSTEANEANIVKRDTPVMCVIGNPPYSGESANKGQWIMKLMEDYKKEPGGKEKLNERNPKMINDDYVKFLRYGQHLIEKNGSGILAFINPHGYLDNATFRGMRWNLQKTFDKIYVIDLNGSVKKNKLGKDAEKDENVFDITTGVSINIFIKTNNLSVEKSKLQYCEMIGSRKEKYKQLSNSRISNLNFVEIPQIRPNYFMNVKEFTGIEKYESGIVLSDLFGFFLSGLSSKNDEFCIAFSHKEISSKIADLSTLSISDLKNKYNLFNESSSWSLTGAIKDVTHNFNVKKIIPISYRPFDTRYTYYTGNSMGFLGRPKGELGKHLVRENITLVTLKKSRSNSIWNCIGISNKMITEPTTITSLDGNYAFPLYLYPDTKGQQSFAENVERTPNLNMEIVNQIAEEMGLRFTNEKEQTEGTFAPIDVLDYIYAVLHSPAYRERFKEFLKLDFPRVPYPKNKKTFWQLVALGSQIRQIHLLESPIVEEYITSYPIDGDNTVTKPQYKDGRVYINDTQYFEGVPLVAWEFYIGGYQPAQKWLKDRKTRTLEVDDILHYQKVIVALSETHRLMQQIDKIGFME